MSSEEHEVSTTAEVNSPNAAKNGRASFRLGRVALVAGVCALVFAAVVYFFGMVDGAKWLADLMEPPRVAATGQVFYQGKPLPSGELRTQPVNASTGGASTGGASTGGAIGFIDAEGKFTLSTVKDGNLHEGAYVGEYKVTVAMFGPQFAAGAKPITPEKYASFDTTPLTLRVSTTADENRFTFTLEDDPNAPPRKPARDPGESAGGRPGGPGGPGGRPGGGPGREPPSPDAIFQRIDKNKDGKITEDEAPARFWGRLLEADADGDNVVSHEELSKAAEKRAAESRAGGEQEVRDEGEQEVRDGGADAESATPQENAQPEPNK